MVMTPQPAFDALKALNAGGKRILYMSPRGRMLDKDLASDLSKEEELFILCGHYEGVDQRIIDAWNMEEVSVGDYILTGGELPAMIIADSVLRLLPGILKEGSAEEESFENGLLEYPQYTQPAEYEGRRVPEVLLSGNHEKIRRWRLKESLRTTYRNRPDLLKKRALNEEEQLLLCEVMEEEQESPGEAGGEEQNE